jgi:hypothetical protein
MPAVLLASMLGALAPGTVPTVLARKYPVCPDGRFVQTDRILPGSADGAFDAVVIQDGQASIESGCAPTRVRLRGTRSGTRVRAKWKRCGDIKKVRLQATIIDDAGACTRLFGSVKVKRNASTPLSATLTGCGDGIVDTVSGETCEPPTPGCNAECGLNTTGPIDAPARTWTWVPFPNAYCADGSTTGIGVNPGDAGGRLVIYLMGGGACWDEITCYQARTAFHIEGGYDAAEFAVDQVLLSASLFDRNDAANPFRNDSFVFVPYCTGDVHTGNNPNANYGGRITHHVGYRNMTAFLARIVPTFSSVSRVILSGSSAGGYGALSNWWQTQQAFGALRVDLIDDSGPPLPPPYATEDLEQTWRTAWNLDPAAPPGCTGCADSFDAIIPFYGTSMTGRRAALLSYDQDVIIPSFYMITGTQFQSALGALAAEMAPFDVWRHFFVAGTSHTLLGTLDVAQGGVTVREFVTKMVEDDPTWASVEP